MTSLFVGEFARTPRYQGAGSSQVTPTRVDSVLESFTGTAAASTVAPGASFGEIERAAGLVDRLSLNLEAPSAAHLAELLERLRAQPARMILRAAYQSPQPSQWLATKAGIPAVELFGVKFSDRITIGSLQLPAEAGAVRGVCGPTDVIRALATSDARSRAMT